MRHVVLQCRTLFGFYVKGRPIRLDLDGIKILVDENRSSSNPMTASFSVPNVDGVSLGVLFEQAAPERRWDSNDQRKQE